MGDHDLREPGADGRGRPAADARGGRRPSATAGSSTTPSIGEVTDTGALRALCDDEVVGEIPARLLTDECPRYAVEPQPRAEPRPCCRRRRRRRTPRRAARAARPRRTSAAAPGSTAATTISSARAPCAGRGSTPPCCGCARRCAGSPSRSTARAGIARLDPRTGGALAVLEAARNVACAGGEPLGLTDCLNFGNPEKGEIAWELAEAIEGMAEACEALGIPVVSGNVSLYNETDGPRDPPDAGRRLRRAGRRRAAGAGRAGARATSSCSPASPRRRSPAPSTRRSTASSAAGPARLDLAPRRRWSSSSGAPRRSARSSTTSRRGRARGRARRGGAPLAASAPSSTLAGRPARLVRRGRRPGGARLRPRRRRAARRRPAAAARRRRRRARCSAVDVDELREAWQTLMCGVFGIRSAERDVARLAYFGLFALQHRGQESAGIAVSDRGRLTVLRDMGLVAQVFDEQKLQALPGRGRDRPHPLLDDRLDAVDERAAARPARPRPHGRARPQRQPRQHRRAARRARRRRASSSAPPPTPS